MPDQTPKKEQTKWEAPDWAPKDAGAVLLRDGDWILIKDYFVSDHRPTCIAVHLCEGGEWVLEHHPPTIAEGRCDTCKAEPPEAFLGFAMMAGWER